MKKFLVLFILTLSAAVAFALEVDVDEIMSAKKIKFTNYTGKPTKVESRDQVKSIGTGLGRTLKRIKSNQTARHGLKYSIVHATSEKEKTKYSADIFSVDKNARVNHINDLRRIIAGYLQSYYAYSKRDAETLAVFSTFYNAVYRGNLKYFNGKYKQVVVSKINATNAGISTKYFEWPGQTKLLIPLTTESKRGKLDKIDPFLISSKKVRAAMRKDDKNLKARKTMVDLKEKDIKKDKKKTEQKKKKIVIEKKKAEKKEKIIAKKKKQIQARKAQVKKEKAAVKKIKDPKKKIAAEKKIKKKEEKITKEEKKIAKAEKEVKKKTAAIKEEEKEVKKAEKEIAKKEVDLKEEKKELKDDEIKSAIDKAPSEAKEKLAEKAEKLKEKEEQLDKREDRLKEKDVDKNVYANKLYYLKIKEYLENGHYNNEMYMIEAASRRIMFKSPVKNIAGRKYDVFSNGVVVITHVGNNRAGHRLTMLSRENLEALIVGADNIFWRSFIIIKDNHIYAVMKEGDNYFLGRFDEKLKQVARSEVRIAEDTFISFYDQYVYINSVDKKIMVLKKKDLSLLELVQP